MSVTFSNPVIVSAVMSTSYKTQLAASGYGTSFPLRVKRLRWVGASSGTLVIQDGNGNTLFDAAYNSADQDYSWAQPEIWPDFLVSTITNGVLYVHLV